MFGLDQPSHWLVIALLAAVLFGYKKLPDASRSLGRSLRIFKTELKGMAEDDKTREEAAQAAPAVVEPAPAPTQESASVPSSPDKPAAE